MIARKQPCYYVPYWRWDGTKPYTVIFYIKNLEHACCLHAYFVFEEDHFDTLQTIDEFKLGLNMHVDVHPLKDWSEGGGGCGFCQTLSSKN